MPRKVTEETLERMIDIVVNEDWVPQNCHIFKPECRDTIISGMSECAECRYEDLLMRANKQEDAECPEKE